MNNQLKINNLLFIFKREFTEVLSISRISELGNR